MLNVPCMQELENELKQIKAAKGRGAGDLLTHLKQHHPPKFSSSLEEPLHDQMRLRLRKASFEYHPDKQVQCDRKWQVLAGVISKCINDMYSCYKS